jgi:hypothetical protein
MEDIISNAKKMAKNAKSNMLSVQKKISEKFSDPEDSNRNIKVFGYLLLMLIIIIVLVMSYNSNGVVNKFYYSAK